MALDRKESTLLVLFDLSSAFDTTDHTILFNWLSKRYSVQGYTLRWIASYLQDCKQRVVIGQATTEHHAWSAGGIRAGACTVLPVCPTSRRCQQKTGVKFHHYADDQQLMHTFAVNSTSLFEAIQRLQVCSANALVKELSINVGGELTQAVNKVRNLGVYLENDKKMSANTSELVSHPPHRSD